jgi:hypothetical protein
MITDQLIVQRLQGIADRAEEVTEKQGMIEAIRAAGLAAGAYTVTERVWMANEFAKIARGYITFPEESGKTVPRTLDYEELAKRLTKP